MEDLFFHFSTDVHFGIDTLSLLGVTALDIGSRVMLVCDPILRDTGIFDAAEQSLKEAGISPLVFEELGPFSTTRNVEKGIEIALKGQVQCVIGLGGVSTLSGAKAIAGFAQTTPLLDPVFGQNEVQVEALPFIGVPSSFRDPFMLSSQVLLVDGRNRISRIVSMKDFSAHTIIFDPQLSQKLAPVVANSIFVELLSQSMEGYFSTASNFITQSLFLRGINLALECIEGGAQGIPGDEIVTKACQAGLLSGLGFSMGRLGIASAIGYAVNGLHQIPSASINAIMLPYLLDYASSACPDKLLRIGPIIDPRTREMEHQDAVEAISNGLRLILGRLELPMRLSQYGIQAPQLPLIARTAAEIGVTAYLPAPLTVDGILGVLKQAL